MTKTVSLTTHLRADPDTVWHWVKKPGLLDYVAAPLIKFRLHEPLPRFADWPARNHKASMMQFGVLPIGMQIVGIEYPDRVHIDAGFLTLGVAAFARVFYAHRQRRWRKLVDLDFAPLKKQERA